MTEPVSNKTGATTDVKFREDKLVALMLYVGAKCGLDEHYGVLKLNKILFYADFRAYKTLQKPITGSDYKKYKHGPAPRGMKTLRQRLIDAGRAIEYKNPLPYLDQDDEEMSEKRLLPRETPNLELFSSAELAIVDSVIEWLRPKTGTVVSKMSHKHPGWDLAQMGEPIPYFTELLVGESTGPSKKDLAWASSVATQYARGEIRAS